jgi:hypothetical protein
MTPKADIEPVATLVERLQEAAGRCKRAVEHDAHEGLTVELAQMAQYRLEEAASALLALEGERDALREAEASAEYNAAMVEPLRQRIEALQAEVRGLQAKHSEALNDANYEFGLLWADMDKSRNVPTKFLDLMSDLIDGHLPRRGPNK